MSQILKSLLSLAVLPLLGIAPAMAEVVTFAAGPAYGNFPIAGGTVTCRIYNNGTKAKLSKRRIISNTNTTVPQDSNSCTANLAPQAYCAYTHNVIGNFAFTCTITAKAERASIVGIAEFRDSNGVFVMAVPFSR